MYTTKKGEDGGGVLHQLTSQLAKEKKMTNACHSLSKLFYYLYRRKDKMSSSQSVTKGTEKRRNKKNQPSPLLKNGRI
jgi:hypothetical protein